MPSPFSTKDFQWAITQLEDQIEEWQTINALFITGDHWQDGDAWAGPRPPRGEEKYNEIMLEIERSFVSKNAIGEVVSRHVDGVLGNEPSWRLTVVRPLQEDETPTSAEQALIDEAEAALTNWWDKRGLHQVYRKALAIALGAGRGPLRFLIPSGRLVNNLLPKVGTLDEALDYLYLDPEPVDSMVLVKDPSTRSEAGIYRYSIDSEDGLPQVEIELVYIDGADTILVTLRDSEGTSEISQGLRLNLGGRLTQGQVQRNSLITPQIVQQQKLLNVALTMLGRNVVQGGFLERIITNAQIPGEFIPDPTAPTGQRFVPASLKQGAGTTQYLTGQPIKNDAGQITGRASVGVIYKDPVDVTTFVKTKNESYLGILEEAHQSHVAMNDDATASGKSRREARHEFINDLKRSKASVDITGRWIVETALTIAAVIVGNPTKYSGLRAVFDALVDTGPIDDADEASIINVYGAGLRSRQTSMVMLGTDDPDAEIELINSEHEQALGGPLTLPSAPATGDGETGTGEDNLGG
jgi:hypothetical protein